MLICEGHLRYTYLESNRVDLSKASVTDNVTVFVESKPVKKWEIGNRC